MANQNAQEFHFHLYGLYATGAISAGAVSALFSQFNLAAGMFIAAGLFAVANAIQRKN